MEPSATVEKVRYAKRRSLFDEARRAAPARVPINVMLFPMDGDPDAPFSFWQLAMSTGGALLAPSEDWP